MASESDSLLDKLDSIAPIQRFDAFPKLPSTYKSRTSGGGLITVLVLVFSTLLVLNDFYEFIWGWPDYEFSVDNQIAQTMILNADLVVNMPCHYLTVDLRDAVGDRLHLSSGFRRDGTIFDPGQARVLQNFQDRRTLAARDAVALSRRNRGLFAWLWGSKREFAPTYNYRPDGSACRVYGSVEVKKVTANLHVTTLGHGYGSYEHTDHSKMNLSHIITEFSFGPYIPDIVQPLDYSYEVTHHPFSIFQYYLTVVPTTYFASPSRSVKTNQYSVTHYVKHVEHGQGVPGIFFKFDIDPMAIAVHQRTTTFVQFLIRVVGVVGGVWVCAGWAFKIGGKAAEVVVGSPDDDTLVADAKTSSRKSRWVGGSLSKRKGSAFDENNSPGWSAAGSPYGSYLNTPAATSAFGVPPSPYLSSPYVNGTPNPSSPHHPTVRGSSGQWASTPSGFPPSPFPGGPSNFPSPPLPSSTPYSPGFPRSVSGGSTNSTQNLSPSGALSPPPLRSYDSSPAAAASPSVRPTSSLNPNRVFSGGSSLRPASTEKKLD